MRKPFLSITVCLALVTTIAVMGRVQSQTRTRETHFSTREKAFSLPRGAELTVRVNNQSDYGITAIEALKGAEQVSVKAWKVDFDNSVYDITGAPKFKSISPLDDANIKINGDTIVVDGAADARTAVKVVAPAQTRVALYINDRIVRAGPLNQSVMARGLALIDTSHGTSDPLVLTQTIIAGPRKVPVQMLTGDSIISPSRAGGSYKVPWNTLKSQAEEATTLGAVTSRTARMSTTGPCANCPFAIVTLSVDQSGLVTDVQRATGNQGIADAAIETLRTWRFRPFVVNGQAVPVTTDVPVKFVEGKLVFESDDK